MLLMILKNTRSSWSANRPAHAWAVASKQLRCVAMNRGNMKTNDVMGEASGGVPYFVGCYDNHFCVFNLLFVRVLAF